jgi:hypothetical protein
MIKGRIGVDLAVYWRDPRSVTDWYLRIARKRRTAISLPARSNNLLGQDRG